MEIVKVTQKCLPLAIVLFLLTAAPAYAQQLPPPESVSLDKLGYMSAFPPVGDKIINSQNKSKYPQLRWTLQHVRELVPTRNIRRGAAAVLNLPAAPRNLHDFVFEDEKGGRSPSPSGRKILTRMHWLFCTRAAWSMSVTTTRDRPRRRICCSP